MEGSPPPKKRRIPKACKLCRTSKLKCDGGKPCTRCRTMKIECDYYHQEEDPIKQKLAEIEAQMSVLSSRIAPDTSTAVALLQLQQQQQQSVLSPSYSADYAPLPHDSPMSLPSNAHQDSSSGTFYAPPPPGFQRHPSQNDYQALYTKRKRGDFEVTNEASVDVIGRGLISYDEGLVYFRCFFQGCDKYVPVFDPKYDTFDSVRSRSSMLFDTICAIGCRAEHGPMSPKYQVLANANKSPISEVLMSTQPPSVETIQALLINACYNEKGWFFTSMATRMALDLDLPKAYNDITTTILANCVPDVEREAALFRRTRVWFGTFVLEHILSLDCGKKPGVTAIDGMRRCRVILSHPARTALDIRLLSQVELNSIRALAHDRLSPPASQPLSDRELSSIVQNTRIDLNIWLSDWINLADTNMRGGSEDERDSLIVNMTIQRDWGEMTMLCKGLQGIGIDNVAIMTDEQQELIHLARMAAQRHLSTMISNPLRYLGTFRYGMDFVWAKCAFSVLLLLKLARIMPSSTNMPALIADAKVLLSHLSKAGGYNNIYFRILDVTISKCERALGLPSTPRLASNTASSVGDGAGDGRNIDRSNGRSGGYDVDAETDFQSYIPKEFILDWNFPGLTFCWIPFDFQDMFLDFGSGF